MKKKIDREKLFMIALIVALVGIFVGLFSYGLSSVLAMEGSFPPNILEEGITPAPESKEAAFEFLNRAIDTAIKEKPKLESDRVFDLNKDSIVTASGESFEFVVAYIADDFNSHLNNGLKNVSTDFGHNIDGKLNIPAFTAEDIKDFKCEYIYYTCPSCGEESNEPLESCELCGGIYPYKLKYRDEYTITMSIALEDNILKENFNKRTPEEALALCDDAIESTAEIRGLHFEYRELKLVFCINRLTDKLTFINYSKRASVGFDMTFLGQYAQLGTTNIVFEITENDRYNLIWPEISLSSHEMMVEPKETNNLLATLTCTDPKIPTVTWVSSDESIVSVDEEGYFKAGKTEGEAVITASFEFNGQTYTDECVVKVMYPVESSKMKNKKVELNVGESETLEVKISPDNATVKTVTWHTEDESIATIDENGVVKAVAQGVVTVYSLTDDGYYKSSCEVTVK